MTSDFPLAKVVRDHRYFNDLLEMIQLTEDPDKLRELRKQLYDLHEQLRVRRPLART